MALFTAVVANVVTLVATTGSTVLPTLTVGVLVKLEVGNDGLG